MLASQSTSLVNGTSVSPAGTHCNATHSPAEAEGEGAGGPSNQRRQEEAGVVSHRVHSAQLGECSEHVAQIIAHVREEQPAAGALASGRPPARWRQGR